MSRELEPRVAAVIETVCAVYGIHPSKIRKLNRPRTRAARHVVIFICQEAFGMSSSRIKAQVGTAADDGLIEAVVNRLASADEETARAFAAGMDAASKFSRQPRARSGRRRPRAA